MPLFYIIHLVICWFAICSAYDFQDEFDGASIDRAKWNILDEPAKWNKELQFYSKDEVWQQNSYLTIRSQRRTIGTNRYTSARIDTQNKFDFLYGEIEWRAKLPAGQGLWPALWLLGYENLPNSSPVEIDIMEARGDMPDLITCSLHFNQSSKLASVNGRYTTNNPDFTRDFHTFKLVWEPTFLGIYVDNNLVLSICDQSKIPYKKMYIIMNVAIGGTYPGNPTEQTKFPTYMLIDYVRVKKWSGMVKRHVKQLPELNLDLRLFNDMKSLTVTTPDACWLECAKLDNCYASSHYAPSYCFLFDTFYTAKKESGWTSYVKKCIFIDRVYLHRNLRLSNSLASMTTATEEQCWNRCIENSKCVAVSFNLNNCFLFDTNFQYTKSSGWISYVYKSLDSGSELIQPGQNIVKGVVQQNLRLFNDIQSTTANSVDQCWSQCGRLSECTAVSFYANNNCFLFGSNYEVAVDVGWVTISTATITKRDFYINKNLRLHDHFHYVNTKSDGECFMECKARVRCRASSFMAGDCYLFDSVYTVEKQDGWVSYTRQKIN